MRTESREDKGTRFEDGHQRGVPFFAKPSLRCTRICSQSTDMNDESKDGGTIYLIRREISDKEMSRYSQRLEAAHEGHNG